MMTGAPRRPDTAERDQATLHYRTAGASDGKPEERTERGGSSSGDGPSLADRITHWLTVGILGIVLSIWAVVGAIFWLPLLVRTMVRFSVSLVQSTMDAEQPDAQARTLREAVSFYRRGFTVAIDAVLRHEDSSRKGKVRRGSIDSDRLLRELLWAAVIWYLFFWAVGVAATPGDIWAWVLSWPWGEAWGTLTGWITEAMEGLVGAAEAPPVEVVPPTEGVQPAGGGGTSG